MDSATAARSPILSTESLSRLKQLAAEKARDENEADTRHQIIDLVLHDVLAWPRNRVSVEEYIAPGYADYVLRKPR
jgi:hypothetical protein